MRIHYCRISLIFMLALFLLSISHVSIASQFGWPPMFGAQPKTSPTAQPWFPPGMINQRQQQRQQMSFFPFQMGTANRPATSQQWSRYQAPTVPFFSQSATAFPGNPMMGFGGMGGMGGMGMMMSPMMGMMAPMMTNYAMASMNPTTMTNFFGLMSNQGGGMGMMPFGSFGMPMGGFNAPTNQFQMQNRGNIMPWFQQGTNPAPFGSRPGNRVNAPSMFPFFNQVVPRR